MKLLKKELTAVNSMEEAIRITGVLEANGIESRYELNSRNSTWLGRGTIRSYWGNIGGNEKYDTLYYVYVNKEDYEEAQHILRNKR